MVNENRWLTLSEASRLLGVHPATLRQWADAGQVPSYRTPGGHRRFEASELRAYLCRPASVRRLPKRLLLNQPPFLAKS